jgi:hypothetical protein
MTRDIVIVPTHNRPELLALCLEHLAACHGISDKDVWVRAESRGELGRYAEENYEVIKQFAHRFCLFYQHAPQHSFHGNSFNLLTAYKDAYHSGAERVYLVEDDVLVSPDFFRWHDALLSRHPGLFCSVGWHCLRRGDVPRGATDPHAYFLSKEDYASIGVCWPRDMLGRVVLHATMDYFNNPAGYLKRHFSHDPLSLDFSEQDGLIMRVLRETNAPVSWPFLRRCSHVGWYGYHRPDGPKLTGDLDVKTKDARRIVSDPDLLRKCGVRFGGDTEAIIPVSEWEPELLMEHDLCRR